MTIRCEWEYWSYVVATYYLHIRIVIQGGNHAYGRLPPTSDGPETLLAEP
jgi:hypothetical protein